MKDVERISEMIRLQDHMNSVVNPAWRDAGYRWQDALMVEAVEAFDHTNWKWWKSAGASPDWDQIKLEVIDLWHFLLSISLEDEKSAASILEDMTSCVSTVSVRDVEYLREVFRSLAADSINGEMLEVYMGLGQATFGLGMTIEDVYKLYVSKNVLNIFRQQNGYKTGEYFKDWCIHPDGDVVEDNQVLTEIIDNTDPELFTAEYLSKRLTEEYAKVRAYRATSRT